MRKCLAEILGTFVLVFAGTGAIVVNAVTGGAVTHVGIGLTFGLVVMALIYALGDVSGAHLNPAVTLGFYLARRFPARSVAPYVLSQIAGAITASAALLLLFGNHGSLGATHPRAEMAGWHAAALQWQSFGLEAVLTGILMFVILCVSTGSKEVGAMAGIAVGGVIAVEALFAGPICGASMNPARSLAPALVSGDLHALWIYLAGPLLGAAAAVPLWRLMRAGADRPASTSTTCCGTHDLTPKGDARRATV
jgi:aquaporin Z